MIEILILISLSKNIAAKAREKGRSGGAFVVLLLALWIGGELFGAILGCVVSLVALDDDEPNMLMCYAGALGGAIVGAVVAFLIVKAIAPTYSRDEDDYERYDRDEDRY
jgi:membrane associated rhomboid family serine protease